jgi:hypothetical protein
MMLKRLTPVALALLSGIASADPYSMVLTQRNSTDTGNVTRVMTVPTSQSLWYYDPSTQLPGYVTLGTGFTFSAGQLALTSAPVNADWASNSGLSQILNKPILATVATSGSYNDLNSKPSFSTVATSGLFSDLLSKPTTLSGYGITDAATSAALSAGLAGKFNTPTGTTSQYVRGDGTLATLPTVAARSFSYPTRALATCFQISSTRDAQVSYGVDISTTVTLGGSPQGTVYLRTYTNSACTTGQQTIISSTAGQPTTLSVTVGQTMIGTANLSGIIPAGVWVQIESQNNSGTPTFTPRQGEEVQL